MSMNSRVELGSLKSCVIGFVFSLVLTVGAYLLVTRHVAGSVVLIASVIVLGVAQAVVQLLFFLNLGQESRPHWRLHALIFMAVIALIVVGGSLWIMYNLDYRVMSEMDMTQQMQKNL